MRACEAVRKDSILHDPYARTMLKYLRPVPLVPLPGIRALSHLLVARHRVMEDAFLEDLPAVAQVLVLGAGYDMRAYRFAADIGDRPVFEVDHPATAARKSALIAEMDVPSVDVRRVTVDFLTESLPDRLLAAGFGRGKPTFVFWEGVTMYLTKDAIAATLGDLRALVGEGSGLVLDFWKKPGADADVLGRLRRRSARLLSYIGEPIVYGPTEEEAVELLASRGFRAEHVWSADALKDRYYQGKRLVYPDGFVVHARAV